MQFCIPVNKNEGLQSEVSCHFRLAPLLLVVDSETKGIVEIDNRELRNFRGLERFQILSSQQQFNVLLTHEIGVGAIRNLHTLGIKVFRAVSGTLAENIDALKNNTLQEMGIPDMKGQTKGMGQGRGLNCCGVNMGRGMGRQQGFGRRQQAGAQRRGLGRGHIQETPELVGQGIVRAQGKN